jgi:tetratricopeptide (TPR) repeat protein
LGIVAAAYDYDWAEAERLFSLAMSREPIPSDVRGTYGYFYLRPIGRHVEAIEQIRKSVQDDPLNYIGRISLAISLAENSEVDEALAEVDRVLELHTNHPAALVRRAEIYARLGRDADALQMAERAHVTGNPQSVATLAGLLVRHGDIARAEVLVKPSKEAPETYGAPRALFIFYSLSGDLERAGYWLEKAIRQRDPFAAASVVRGYIGTGQRFPELARLMNLP